MVSNFLSTRILSCEPFGSQPEASDQKVFLHDREKEGVLEAIHFVGATEGVVKEQTKGFSLQDQKVFRGRENENRALEASPGLN